MSKNETNRVLNRVGAREVTQDELEQVAAAGGPDHTLACTATNSFKGSTDPLCDPEL